MSGDFEDSLERELIANRPRWYRDPVRIALLSLVLSGGTFLATAAVSSALYFISKSDEKTKRAVVEIERVYDKDFTQSLDKIVDHASKFLEDKKLNDLKSVERFNTFWNSFYADADMLLISSRISAIVQCAEAGDCNKIELYSRFPDTVYQAIFFLREFIFLDDELAKSETTALDGWWFDDSDYKFFADFCTWNVKHFGGMNLWSTKDELIRAHGGRLPGPCLPRKR